MKKHIIILLVFISCSKENKYELALNKYLKNDLQFKQIKINHQIDIIRMRASQSKKRYGEFYNRTKRFNELCLIFEKEALENDNKYFINTQLKTLKDSLQNLDIINLNNFPSKINNTIEKYDLLRLLKEFNYSTTQLVLSSDLSNTLNNFYTDNPGVLALRLNENQVILNLYCEYVKEFSSDFDYNSFQLIKLEDLNGNKINYVSGILENTVKSYIIQSKSDTLYLEAMLKTKDEIGLVVGENKSMIVVGQHRNFDKDFLNEYLEFKFE